ASGQDFRADAAASLGVLGGVIGARLGWPWLDPLVGFLIALLVFRTGLVVTRDAVDELMDRASDPELVQRVTRAARTVEACRAVEQIHSRSMGSYRVVDLVIGVPGHLSVQEGDEVAHQVEAAIRQRCPEVAQVRVHVDPV
ncbi:MAG TPA: cation diffusion facilitator family transporter, partial [Limnochorda sp.]